jgi:hypothetical protein
MISAANLLQNAIRRIIYHRPFKNITLFLAG